jgi:V8-like Glu-specific endopeptidase
MEKTKKEEKSSKSKQHNSLLKDVPVSMLEQAIQYVKHADLEWFNERREARPAKKRIEPAGGIVLPHHLKEGGNKLIHKSFNPREYELISGNPKSIGKKAHPALARFSGKKIRPANFEAFFGPDNRYVYYDDSYPWRCVGRISWGNEWGSATLVGENFVLTASHVVAGTWTAGKPLTTDITFVPAMFNGTSMLGANWTAKVTGIAAWQEIDAVVGYDMALCQLDKPMGDWLGYFGSRGFDNGWENQPYWSHIGYPYDLSVNGVEPSFQSGITVNDDDSDNFDTFELETDADVASGQSGGPLWGVWNDGGHQIIGVLSGNENDSSEYTNIFAGGSGLNSLVKWGRDNWK